MVVEIAQISLQDIFAGYVKKKSIFLDKGILATQHMPDAIPHRDEQMKQLAMILQPALRGEKPSNIFSYGKTGTGKTLCTRHVLSELQKFSENNGNKIRLVYVNCKMRNVSDTNYRIFAQLCKEFGRDVPMTGLPTNQIYQLFYEAIDTEKQTIIIVLDEVDALVKKLGDGVLYDLTRINETLKSARVSIIGITNDLSFTETLDARVRSSLSEEEIIFPPYNATELREILEQRAGRAFISSAVSPAVIAKCAALAAQEHGDARRALDLLRVAAEIAERNNRQNLSEGDVDAAEEKIDLDRISEVVRMQPKQSQAVLWSIIKLLDENKSGIRTGDVYNHYLEVCKKTGLAVLTQRRVSGLVSELDMLGIINARVVSRGRGGRTREIFPTTSEPIINNVKRMLSDEFYFE